MLFEKVGAPLRLAEIPVPLPEKHQIVVAVEYCGLCRTDLHVIDGELPHPKLPLVLGHQIVGRVVKPGSKKWKTGDRVGIPWLAWTCGECTYCREGKENLCEKALYTGYQVDGGMAEYCAVNSDYCFKIPEFFESLHAAPLLCAGLIGYRAWRLAGKPKKIGFYGFGSSAHILTQLARYHGDQVFAFTRPGDEASQAFALKLGAVWAGGTDQKAPEELDAAILFAPVGSLVPLALAAVKKGGRVVCAGIHMSDIPSFSYDLLWGERSILSVANLTRQDGREFFQLAPQVPIHTQVKVYALEDANQALDDLRHGRFEGSAVVKVED